MKKIITLLVICALTIAIKAQEINLLRGPYLQMLSPSGVHIKWRSLMPGALLKYGTDPNNLNLEANAPASQLLDYTVVLQNLSPNTTYYYQIFSNQTALGEVSKQVFTTHPLKGTRKKSRIWVLGDSGMNNVTHTNTRDAYNKFSNNITPDVWLMLGDNAYLTGQDIEYQRGIFDIYPDLVRKTAIYPTFGNHDSYGTNPLLQMGPYFSVFDLPTAGELGGFPSNTEYYYSFDYANIHFVSIDANMVQFLISPTGMQEWLEEDLKINTQDFTVVYFHHPPYTKGSHDSDTESELINMREIFTPLFEQYGVDLVLSGHSHSYERSYLINGHRGLSESFSEENKVQSGNGNSDGAYVKPAGRMANTGTVYVVAGSSCQTGGGSLDHKAMCSSLDSAGSFVIDVEDNVLKGTFISQYGNVLDEFSIEKSNFNGLSENQVKTELSLYPNPVVDEMQVSWDNPKAGDFQLRVLNTAGQLVYEESLKLNSGLNNRSLKLAQLASGFYTLQIQGEHKEIQASFSKL